MPADGMGRMGGVWGCDVKAGQEKKKKKQQKTQNKKLWLKVFVMLGLNVRKISND